MDSISIGNDIVDLAFEEPELHPRYTARVFTDTERDLIGSNVIALWTHWTAKEAAFKAVRRLNHGAQFVPKSFEYDPSRRAVFFEGSELPCRHTITDAAVYARCVAGSGSFPEESLRDWVVDLDASPIKGDPSRAVRAVAIREIAELLQVSSERLVISYLPGEGALKHSGIPCLLIGGAPSHHLLSFTHHGRFACCAFLQDPQLLERVRSVA